MAASAPPPCGEVRAAPGGPRPESQPTSAEFDPQFARLLPERPGDHLGRYKLLHEIGEGGFGTVWMAEQVEPVSRRVALKIIKLGMDTREVIARFESERQALALMEHEHIARVFDAGTTALGRPYFVMELVSGIPITDYCDQAALGTRARLALFGDVCAAINHAHQKGIIHRDIKPSNVMVTLHGEKAVVKVIDFGIAKAMRGRLTDKTLYTRFEEFVGTPAYMSPEQVDWGGFEVDTRSDIYALGVLLYQLLTGSPPFDVQTLETAGYEEVRRIVREVEPPRPSARLRTTTGDERVRLAKKRQVEPAEIGQLVEPDLDWIVMKAIEKDLTQRYQTVNAFAHDLTSFLADEPVSARPPSAAYLFRKFARRHRGALQVAAALLVVLLTATAVSTWQAIRARQAEQLAQFEAQRATQQKRWAVENLRKAEWAEQEARAQSGRADAEAETAQRNLYYAQMHLGLQAWREHRGLKHLQNLLAGWIPASPAPDRRGWEWYYLSSLADQNLRTLTPGRLGSKPSTVAWHAASQRLAEGTAQGAVRVWDAGRGQLTETLQGPIPWLEYWGGKWLAWHPDGQHLAAGGRDGSVHVWRVGTGQDARVFRDHSSPVSAVAFSSDGRRLAAFGTDGLSTIWEVESGRPSAVIRHPGGVSAAAWSPDDRLFAAGHVDGSVTFSGTRTGDPLKTLQAHPDQIYALAWSSDGARLATSSANDFFVYVWEVATLQKVLGPLRHSHGIKAMAWEPGGRRLATGSFDQTVKIWDAQTGLEQVTLRGQEDSPASLAWGPDGRLASGADDGSVKIWDSLQNQEWNVLAGHGRRATAVAWSPDGRRLASAGDDGRIRLWDAATRQEKLSWPAHDVGKMIPQFGVIRALVWSPDGTRVASGGLDGVVRVWDLAANQQVFALPEVNGVVWCLAWSPDGKVLAVGAQDGTIRLIENLHGTPAVRAIAAHEGFEIGDEKREGVRSLAWNPAGDRLASTGWDKLAKIWDPQSGAEMMRLPGATRWLLGVSWSPDGRHLATSAADRLVLLWEVASGRRLQTLRGHTDFVDAVRWSPDGTRLATAGLDNSIRFWDPRTGQETFVLRGTSGMFHDVAWHPSGTQLAAASSDGQIWIWDASIGYTRDATSNK